MVRIVILAKANHFVLRMSRTLNEGDSHAWLGDGFDEEEEVQEQEFDYHEDEEEAIAWNAMLDLEEADDRQAGEAIQLQLAAFNAFGKAKGKGKGFGKKGFKGKGKGKVVRSQMSIEERRAKLRDLKAKSKRLRCGGMGHWAGDPGCKFANKPQPPKPTANLAYESESSDDEEGFVYVGAATSNEQTNAAMMAFRSGASGKGSRPRPSQAQSSMAHANGATSSDLGARVTPSSVERPMGFDNVFQIGQFKGKTYWDVLHRQPQFYVWAKKEGSRVLGIQQYVQWVDQFFEFRGGEIFLRDEPVQPPPALPGSTKKGTAKATPPSPPLPNKCQNCQEFSFRGSTGYTIRRACLRCGHSSTEKREEKPQYKPEDCPRESTDNRRSSRSTHRVWRKQCCSFVDELPMELRRERVALAKAVESTTQDKVSVIEAITRDDQEVLTPETVL